jgi:hypothetical protein
VYYLTDEPGAHFVWQLIQESLVLAMSRAFDDYYNQGLWHHLNAGGTQRRTNNNDQLIIIATVGVAFVLVCL